MQHLLSVNGKHCVWENAEKTRFLKAHMLSMALMLVLLVD